VIVVGLGVAGKTTGIERVIQHPAAADRLRVVVAIDIDKTNIGKGAVIVVRRTNHNHVTRDRHGATKAVTSICTIDTLFGRPTATGIAHHDDGPRVDIGTAATIGKRAADDCDIAVEISSRTPIVCDSAGSGGDVLECATGGCARKVNRLEEHAGLGWCSDNGPIAFLPYAKAKVIVGGDIRVTKLTVFVELAHDIGIGHARVLIQAIDRVIHGFAIGCRAVDAIADRIVCIAVIVTCYRHRADRERIEPLETRTPGKLVAIVVREGIK